MIETLIVIRTKNEDRWIKHTIEKIQQQTYKNFKIVIVDNLSSDRTIEIVKSYKLPVIRIKKFFPGKAINQAYNKFKSKYVVCLSAHCIPENNNWLKNLIKNFKNKKTVAVYGKQLPIYNTSDANYRDLKIVFGNDRKVQKKDYFFHNANSAIRRSILNKYPFDEKATNIEDRIWAKKIMDLNKYQIVYDPSASVYHHHGLHQNNNKKRLNGVVNIMKNIELDNLVPEELMIKNQNICACVIGRLTENKISNTYIKTNKSLLEELKADKRIKKIYLIIDKELIKKLGFKTNKKFVFIKRSKEIERSEIKDILKFLYKKLLKENIDYMGYFNLDYINRPKNYLDKLLSAITRDFHSVVTFAEKINNLWLEEKNILTNKTTQLDQNLSQASYYASLYGIGSMFFYNSLKQLNFNKSNTFLIKVNNSKYSLRFSQNYD